MVEMSKTLYMLTSTEVITNLSLIYLLLIIAPLYTILHNILTRFYFLTAYQCTNAKSPNTQIGNQVSHSFVVRLYF